MATADFANVGRNDPCPCGSGKRFKHCHGNVVAPAVVDSRAPEARRLMASALEAQQSRRLEDAERLYREAIALAPDSADALHMLGVIRYERRDYAEAKALILRALDLTGWRFPSFRHNLGLVVARANDGDSIEFVHARQREWYESLRAKRRPPDERAPRVAVLIPAYNHARYVEVALESVFAQTYRNVEIVLIDDGSTDGTADAARRTLERSPFPHRMIRRDNRGAAQTLNEAFELASAPYVNVLNSDDAFEPLRLQMMVDEVAATGASWGFSGIAFIDAAGGDVDLLHDPRAYPLACSISAVPAARSTGFALLTANVVVSSGNLFCSRALWRMLGGFRDLRYNHDWEFALRALWHDEPVFVRDALYRYRLHPANTIDESATKPREEAYRVMSDYIALAAGMTPPPNAFAPSIHAWGADFAVAALQGGLAETMEAPVLQHLINVVEQREREAVVVDTV
jgi:glycosyltransferase involved in cell wall biosynthesis